MPQDGSLIDRLLHEKDSRPAESSVGSVKDWFKSTFKRELPIGSFGLDAGHKRMGWEHSRAFDVSLHPSSAEGQQLIKYLESQGISYIASQGASKNATGQVTSTGPHIHVGPPSSRLTKSAPSGNSLVDKLLAAKEGGSAPVAAGTQAAPQSDIVDRFTTIRKQRLTSDKLAADIEWHFGYSTLRAMPTYTPEQQRGVVERARMAAEDDIRKGAAYKAATGKELSLKRDPAWQERNRRDLGLTGDKILDRMYWDTKYAGGTAEDAAKWNKKVREETNFVQNNVFGPTNARIFGGASKTVLDLAAGATDLGRKILTPGRKTNAATEWLREQSSKIAGGIEEAESIRPTGTTYELDMPYIGKVPINPRKGAEELASGALVYGPLVALIPALGIEGVMARLGAQLTIGGTTEGLQSVGRDESWKDVGKHTAAGALQFGLFEVPLAGRTVLRKALSNAVIMGGGTTIINRATGQPWSESAKAGLLMMLLRSPELLRGIKVKTPKGTERPATVADIKDFGKAREQLIKDAAEKIGTPEGARAFMEARKAGVRPEEISAARSLQAQSGVKLPEAPRVAVRTTERQSLSVTTNREGTGLYQEQDVSGFEYKSTNEHGMALLHNNKRNVDVYVKDADVPEGMKAKALSTGERRITPERTDADTLKYAQALVEEQGKRITQNSSGAYEITNGATKTSMTVGKGGLRETTEYLRDQSTRSLLSKGVKLPESPRAVSPIEELNIGLNPAAALRKADNLERPGFTIDRGQRAGRDYGSQARDSFRTPQSNLEFQGWLETILGPLGKKASDALRTYQINKEARRFEWQRKIGAIESHLERARGKADRKTFFGDFIDLIEKEFTDPTRRSNRPDIQEALEQHDALTAQWRQYIIDTRRGLGIEMPDGWGITDRGYFRHLFLGDIKLYKTVEGRTTWIGRVETYAEAQKVALETMRNEPGATVHANAKNQFNSDPTQRLSTGKFWKTVSNLLRSTRETATDAAGGRVHLTQGDILEDVRGTIGLQKSKLKPFGALLKRRGFAGSLQDYTRVMEIHAGQLSRTQELSKFNREWVPMIEEAKTTHPMAAKEMQRLLDDIWGVPRKVEELIGSRVRATPVLRNVVANPDAALRNFTQGSASAQVAAKLDFNARASAINALDPLNTLWPHVSTVEFTKLYADFAKPSTRQVLRDRGVLTGASKFTEGVSEHGKKGLKQRWQDLMGARGAKEIAKALWKLPARPFRMVSDMNRGVGYLHGIKDGTQKGLTGDALHRHGLDWARKVEFDNAKENAAAILRGPLGQLFGQFKGYPMKALENWVTVWHRYPADTNKSLTTRRAKLLASKLAIGGIKTLTSPLRWLGIASGYALVEAVSAGLQEVGFDKETADEAAQMTYYGPPAKGGFDFSASVALIDDPYGHTPEEVLVNTLGGPTVGTIFGLMKAKTAEKAFNVVTPYSRGVYGGMEMAERGFVSVPAQHGERLSLNLHESIGYLFGFTPVRRSISFDQPAKKVGMDKLKERMRAGDANVLKEMTEAAQKGEMPIEDMKEVIHSLKTTEKQEQFKRLTLSQAEYVYSGMSDEDKAAVLDILKIKRVNAKQDPETGKPLKSP